MAVEALCPMCGAVFSLRDDMQGKKVRCTKCEQVFTVGAGKAKPAAEKQSVQSRPAAPAKKVARDEDDDEVSTAKKSRAAAKRGRDDDDDDRPSKKGAGRRGKDDDDDDDGKAKAKKKRVFHDDDDDDDDKPRKPARKKSGGGAGVVLAVVGGVALFVLLLCGGIGYWFVHTANSVIEDANDQMQAAANANNGNPGFQNVGGPFPGQNPEKKVASVDDALRDLKSDNDNERRAAMDWLAKANLDKGRQAEVSSALNPFLKDADNGRREKAVNALKVWGTKDNLDGLVQILNEATAGPPQSGLVYGAIEVVGKLGDERGAEPVWRFRDSAFSWEAADKSLKSMGQAAGEKAALARFDDPNGNIHNAARSLLVFYGTKDNLKLKQVAADLKGDDRNRRNVAFDYLANNPVVESERPAVAVAMNAGLTTSEVGEAAMKAIEKWYTADNVPALVKTLDDDRFPHRHRVMAVLGKLKDVRGAEPVAARLLNGGDRKAAGDALIAMGPVAKPAVEKYATNPDKAVQKEVDRVLASYGADTSNLGLTRLLTELESTEGRRRGDAAKALLTTKVDAAQQAKVARALEKAAEDATDRGAQEQAIKALGVWGTKESGDVLVKIIEGADQAVPCKNAAIEVLVKAKDERVVKPLSLRLLDARERGNAAKHLIALGPEHGVAIENEVTAGLAAQDKNLRIECAKILGAVGTKASIAPLNNAAKAALLAKPQQKDVAQHCSDAAAAIAARGK